MNSLEIVAAALGLVNIVLLVRRSIWNYPAGLAMVTLYAWVFFSARLYSDMLLQGLFFVLQLYGWRHWSRVRAETGDIAVARLRPRRLALVLGAATIVSLLWGSLMARITDAAFPYLDGANAMFSVTAQILLARRLIENWPVWIGVDLLAIGLYLSRGLFATAMLYTLMTAMCVIGWRAWLQAAPARSAGMPA